MLLERQFIYSLYWLIVILIKLLSKRALSTPEFIYFSCQIFKPFLFSLVCNKLRLHTPLECKSRQSRDTWSNRQIGVGVQNEAGKKLTVLPGGRTGHSKHPLPTTQGTSLHMNITRWSRTKSDYIFCSQIWRSSIQSAKTRLGADCGSDHELLIAKFKLILK